MHNWTKLQLLGAVPGQREIFEEICRKIVHAEHPLARTIREEPGDNGIDFFVEYSDERIAVYQAKFFRDKIDDSQQGQIRESYKRVVSSANVMSWTLMVPLELSFQEWSWFKTWRDKQDIPINLLSGLQLEDKIMGSGYEEARKVLAEALHLVGLDLLDLREVERPIPVLAVAFGIERNIHDPNFDQVVVECRLLNRGNKSLRNPQINIEHSKQDVNASAHFEPWKPVQTGAFLNSLNPRSLELRDISVRPGEFRRILPIRYKWVNFSQIGITAEILMEDEPPAQSGLVLLRNEIPPSGYAEKLGQENFIPPLGGGPGIQLSPFSSLLIKRIREANIPEQNKGLSVIGQSNDLVNVAFSALSGMGEQVSQTGFWEAIEELVSTGFLQPLDQVRRRYKLVQVGL
jgi:hypothetical protein